MSEASYTAVLSGAQNVTVRLGQRDVVSTTYSDVGASDVPSFTLADLGHKTQIASYRANGREWHFAPGPMLQFRFWDSLAPTSDFRADAFRVYPAIMDTENVVQNATSFTVTWTSGLYGTIEAAASINVQGALVLNATWTPPGVLLTLFSIVCAEWIFRPLPQVADRPGDLSYLSPARTPHYMFSATTKSDVTHHPGPLNVEPVFFPETPFNASYQAPMYYDSRHDVGLMIRTNDTTGRFKEYRMTGGTTYSELIVRIYNNDIYTVPTPYASFTTPYATWLYPFAGDTDFAAAQLRGWLENEGFFTRPKILADAGNVIPAFIKNADAIWYMQRVGADGATALHELTRIVEDMETVPIVYHYGWMLNEIDESWPDSLPERAEELAFGVDIQPLGCKRILYLLAHGWGITSTWLTTPGAEPDGHDVTRGSPIDLFNLTREQLVDFVGFAEPHGIPDLGFTSGGTDAVGHIVEHWEHVLTDDVNVDGFYLDALAGSFRATNRTSLSSANKGPGQPRWINGVKDLVAEMRSQYPPITGKPFSVVSEQFGDMTAATFDHADTWTYELLVYNALNFAWTGQILFSAYQPFMSFLVYGYDTEAGTFSRAYTWNFQRLLHRGSKVGWAAANGWNHPFFTIPRPGDVQYAAWHAMNGDWLDNARAIIAARAARREVFHSYLEPALPGSYEEQFSQLGSQASFVEGRLTFADSELQSSVHTISHGANAGNMAVVVSNASIQEQDFSLRMSVARYPSLLGKRVIKQQGVTVHSFNGFINTSFKIPAKSVVIYDILET